MNDMTKLGYRELLVQRDALEKQIAEVGALERKGVIDELVEMMALFGITPADLGKRDGRKQRKRTGPVAAKYRNPQSGATWSGRGRAPLWLANQDREKFAIAD
jgi:DNA-binding protein H-NS